MKIDTLAHVKNQISSVIENLGTEPLFITRNGKVAAVLQAMSDEEVEDYLLRNSKRFWKLIESRRSQAGNGDVVDFDVVNYHESAVPDPVSTARERNAEYHIPQTPRKRRSQ